jgi:hypothetical protein
MRNKQFEINNFGGIIMKKIISVMALVLVFATLFAGCGGNGKSKGSKVDYSEYPFVNISWTREGEHDTETIRFNADGSFTYSCGCGNPVNDSDLCEGYTYDDATKTITLNCSETTDEMVTVIKIVKCDENSLQLDFNGDVRMFEK